MKNRQCNTIEGKYGFGKSKLISDTIQKVPDGQKSVDLSGGNCKNMKT
ncbi:MAG: hypothetical protein ACYSU4_19990 [Planctomycetota bacterium]|jgi:hypothetical protein